MCSDRVCVHVYTLIWPAKKKKKNLPGVVVVPLYSRWPSVGNFISFPADDDAQRLGSRYTWPIISSKKLNNIFLDINQRTI
jgi:hypothetical protein